MRGTGPKWQPPPLWGSQGYSFHLAKAQTRADTRADISTVLVPQQNSERLELVGEILTPQLARAKLQVELKTRQPSAPRGFGGNTDYEAYWLGISAV